MLKRCEICQYCDHSSYLDDSERTYGCDETYCIQEAMLFDCNSSILESSKLAHNMLLQTMDKELRQKGDASDENPKNSSR